MQIFYSFHRFVIFKIDLLIFCYTCLPYLCSELCFRGWLWLFQVNVMEKGPWTEWNPSILKCWKLNKTIHHHVANLISCMNWYLDFLTWAHFSYKLGLITHFFASVLIINLVKYNEEMNMTVKFLMKMFKQSCVIMFLKIF